MKPIEKRLERLERRMKGDVYQETVDYLCLVHHCQHGQEARPHELKEIEAQARELMAQGVRLSIMELLDEIDGGKP